LNKDILNTKIQDFIINFSESTTALAFSGSPFKEVSVQELIQQIESRQKSQQKLPSWFASKNVYYPPKISIEQTSSEITGKYKSSLVSGKNIADITGGFGVDSFYFSEKFENVHHFEQNEELSQIAAHNFKTLNKDNISCFSENGIEGITRTNYDVIYIDPSRRHNTKGKVFFLKDCEPNIPENIESLIYSCDILMIKTSPMLDISIGLSELKNVYEIHIVAVDNEVKELLWLVRKNVSETPLIKTVNFTKTGIEEFSFQMGHTAEPVYGNPELFLYEPNASLMKSGAFEILSEAFKIKKLHKHTHLYTSEVLREFPGRRFVIKQMIPYSKNEMRNGITFDKANVTTRNFPESVATLRKKWKLKDGGDIYLFFTTVENDKKMMLICTKI